jgi:phosphohistidine swiveling domain-containing protein
LLSEKVNVMPGKVSAMEYVRPLSRVRLADSPEVGRKAAVLGELRHAGFRVPAGFTVCSGAPADAGPPPDARAQLPPAMAAELTAALGRLGGGPVAVRSSAGDEDGAQASFAGQYESVLNVTGPLALSDAVRRCRASGRSGPAAAYRQGRPSAPGPIGVLVQRMVPADVAGAAFSVNPVTGHAETLVSAVPGLGDGLMAGEVTPEEWVVRGETAELRSGALDALTKSQARAVARLTERVAAYFGTPQDVEWAIAGRTLWLLQARPVTALPGRAQEPVPIEIEIPPGFWVLAPGQDKQWTPMQRSVYLPVLAEHLAEMFAFSIIGPPRAEQIGGWVYLNTGVAADLEGLAARAGRVAAAVAADEPGQVIRRWHAEWKPMFSDRIEHLRGVDLTAARDEEFAAHVSQLAGLFGALHGVYFRLVAACTLALAELGLACQELLGWPPEQAFRLLGGLRGDHMTAIAALADLARMAGERPAVLAALEHADPGTAARLADLDQDFAAAFWDYHRAYAHRTSGFDITEPTLAEQPLVLLGLVRAQLSRPFDLQAERAALDERISAAVAEADTLLSGRSPADRERFHASLAAIWAASAVRDEKAFCAASCWALLRYAVLEAGRRLAERGQIAAADDAFFLERDEMLAALRTGTAQRDLAGRRRGQGIWARAHPGPPFYGTPVAGPASAQDQLGRLSPAARQAVETSLWTMRLWAGGTAHRTDTAGLLQGTAASPGQYTGPARIVRSMAEFGKIRHGDVLVCPATTAQWAVLFPSIGALVADKGGLLSHPAVIAREYGVPAVVAAGRATEVLRDDQVITVDGTTGAVRFG